MNKKDKIKQLKADNARLSNQAFVANQNADYWQEKHDQLNQPIKDNYCETLKKENAQLKEQVQTWFDASMRTKDASLNKSIDQLVIIADLREENTKLKTKCEQQLNHIANLNEQINTLNDVERYAKNAKDKDFYDEYYRRGEEIKTLKTEINKMRSPTVISKD